MDLQLSGKHVLITGGSKGIGLACAHAFLAEGASVSLVSRDAANLQRAAGALRDAHPEVASRIITFAADTGDAAQALAALEQAERSRGPIDVLVNSAGAARRTPAHELLQRAQTRLPLGRIAKPEEIAAAVVFLASPRASYVSGAILAMDGAVTPMVV